jgi:hypothetical protein
MRNGGWLLFAAVALFALFSENPIDWLMTGGVVAFYATSFLKLNRYPIESIAFLIPMMEIVTSLVGVELSGNSLQDGFVGEPVVAYRLSLGAFLCFMAGYRWAMRDFPYDAYFKAGKEFIGAVSMVQLIRAHLILTVMATVISSLFGLGSLLGQVSVHFQKLPLVVLFLIGWKYVVVRSHGLWVLLIFGANLAIRLTSFFSDWKDLLYVAVFVALVSNESWNARTIRRMTLVGLFGGVALFTWQAIKGNYREYLNQGTRSQSVNVSASEALGEFFALAGDYWSGNLVDNKAVLDATIARIGYLDFFSRTVERVPSVLPHEMGDLMLDNLSFALIPRFLNPNKGVKDDQWKVEYYANVPIADNASFSLGRYAEWYIDFGRWGMLVAGLVLGALGGRGVRYIQRSGGMQRSIFGATFATLVLIDFASYQSDEITIYGFAFWATVVYFLVGRKLLLTLVS